MINQLINPKAGKIAPNPSATPVIAAIAGINASRSGGVPQLKMPAGMIPGAPAPITPAPPAQAAMTNNPLPTAVIRPSAAQNAALGGSGSAGGVPQITPPPGMIPGLPAKITPAIPTAQVAAPAQAPIVGGGPGGINPFLGLPSVMQPGQAAPDVNPQSAGTRLGSTLRDAGKGLQNFAAAGVNRALRAGTAIGNTLSQPLRSASGVGVDAARAFAGASPRADSGTTPAAYAAPQITMPNRPTPVNFSTFQPNVPVRHPNFSGVTGGVVGQPGAPVANGGAPAKQVIWNPAAGTILAPATPPGMLPAAPAPVTPVTGATTVDASGKPNQLTYGANVDGVATFSDGTGGIPQTMSPDAMKQLAQERSISRADPGALGHALASDALGHTSSTDEMVAQTRSFDTFAGLGGSANSSAHQSSQASTGHGKVKGAKAVSMAGTSRLASTSSI